MSLQALRLIKRCLENKNLELHLSDCGLTDGDFIEGSLVNNELKKCIHLVTLNLANNQIREIKGLQQLPALKTLYISGNRLVNLKGLRQVTTLKTLYSSSNELVSLEGLEQLINLQVLNVSRNKLSDIKELQYLTSLNTIHLSNNNIIDIRALSRLTALHSLDLSNNYIKSLSGLERLVSLQNLSLNSNQLTDIESLEQLTSLLNLNLSSNQLTDFKELKHLRSLKTLQLLNNQLKNIGGIRHLKDLKKLDLSKNQISDLNGLELLTELTSLDLSRNQIKDITPLVNFLKTTRSMFRIVLRKTTGEPPRIYTINLDNNPLKIPPVEIVAQGNEAIFHYFNERIKQGEEKLYEAKIVVVGSGESGKTTLIKKIIDPSYLVPNLEDKRTQGIKVISYEFNRSENNFSKDLYAHIWDFGGQELYHTTHQLFLTPDTLYILLNDNRKNDTDFYYWLNIVTLRAGEKCPILMVFNAKENAPRQIVPGEELYSAFANLIPETIDVNFADEDLENVYKMKKAIKEHFSRLDVLGKSFPAYWVKVREKLGQQKQEYITWSHFRTICEECQVHDTQQMHILIQTLHNLGVLLYFPGVFGLKDLIILKQQWCIDAIYIGLDTPEIINNGGRFNEAVLATKWAGERFEGNHLQLLKLMQHFDLCYPVGDGTNDYIAPQLLPIEESRFIEFPIKGIIIYRFEYKFMPAGLVTRLIARLSRHAKNPFVWRMGVTFQWGEGSIAEVIENQLTRQIVIRVAGIERKRRLSEIRKTLYDLHSMFRGLKFEELVTCNCADCVKSATVTTFELKALEDDAEYNDNVTCRNGTRKKIPAKEILEGVEYYDKPRIFISYSHKDEELKDEFRTMIAPLEKEGHWKVWDDRWLLPGDKWNPEILRHLSEANVIVLMLSPRFFKSDYIYDIEMTRAVQRHESGDALLIGIIVEDCMWEDTPLQKIQLVPKDGVPVIRHQHRSEIWKTVANKIKETIALREGSQKRKGGWD